MIVKLHPRLELDDTANYYRIVGRYEGLPNVLFLKDFPLVFPLLAHADMYIGDMSSVGYDYLPFNKPMFFLNKQKRNAQTDRGLFLFRCGVEILPEDYPQIYSIIEKSLQLDQENFSKIRQEVYEYTFGEERPFSAIKADILKCLI
jgi:CDP-glycerol glycerophosphotransferase (TagB/SpsB family)